MKKKMRVDFSAHYSVVVAVEECDDMESKAIELAEQYIQGGKIDADWEMDEGGVSDANNEDYIDIIE